MLFAVERYDESGAGWRPEVVFPALPALVRVAAALYIGADEVALALIEGPDEATVNAAVAAAGWRVDRISAAHWITAPVTLPPEPVA